MSCYVSPIPSNGSGNECYLPVAMAATAAASEVLNMKDLKKDDLIVVLGSQLNDYDSQNIEVLVAVSSDPVVVNLLGNISFSNSSTGSTISRMKNDAASSYIQPSQSDCYVTIYRKVKAPLVKASTPASSNTFESVVDMNGFEFFTSNSLTTLQVKFSNNVSIRCGLFVSSVPYSIQANVGGFPLIPRTYLNLFDAHPVSISSAPPRLKCFW